MSTHAAHHPVDPHSFGLAVLRFDRTGREVAWDGATVRALPRNWRDRVTFEAAS